MLDPIFRRLLLFADSNSDGYSQPDELILLMTAGMSAEIHPGVSAWLLHQLRRNAPDEGLGLHLDQLRVLLL